MDHGSKKDDGSAQDHPSLLAFVVGRDGEPFALLSNGQQYQAGSLVKWAEEQLDAYAKEHPGTRMPFVPGKVEARGEGADAQVSCAELDAARQAAKPLLLYFGRGHFDPDDKTAKKENKLARKFEKGTLNSKPAAKEAEGWVLLRFDLSNADHARLAAKHGVAAAPELLLWLPSEEKPTALGRSTNGGKLAYHMKAFNKARSEAPK